MLEIGINEGLTLGPDSKITEKGGFDLHFTSGEATASALDLLEADAPEASSSTLLMFPPNVTNYKDQSPRTSVEIMRDIRADYKKLYTIFNLYFTKDELSKLYPVSSILEGLSITKENEATLLVQESVVNKMFTNFASAALKVINGEKLWEKEQFRIKMLRQSPKKAFPRFSYKPEFGEWVELMTIPTEQSKVGFTKFEIGKGYDDPTIPSDVIDPGEAASEDEQFNENIPAEPAEDAVDFS